MLGLYITKLYHKWSLIIGTIAFVIALLVITASIENKNILFIFASGVFLIAFLIASYQVRYDIYKLKVKLPALHDQIVVAIYENDADFLKTVKEKTDPNNSEKYNKDYVDVLRELHEDGFLNVNFANRGVFAINMEVKGNKYMEGRLFLDQ